MANVILLKRGLASDISNLTLQEGEIAIAYDAEKKSAQLYVGGAEGAKILVTADVTSAVQNALEQANRYADEHIAEKIGELVNGAPQALDTLKELAEELQKNEGVVTMLNEAVGNKVDKVEGKGLSEANFTNEEKEKLAGVDEKANNYTHPATHKADIIEQDTTHRFVTDTDKANWNAKLGAGDTVDGGTF